MKLIVNGQSQTLADGATVAELLRELKLSGQPVAVEVNEHVVPKRQHDAHALADGDRIELVKLVGGG